MRETGRLIVVIFLIGALVGCGPKTPNVEESPSSGEIAQQLEFDELAEWAKGMTYYLIKRGFRIAHDGVTKCFVPDGRGLYDAMWTRDFCYMLEGAGDIFQEKDVLRSTRYLLNGVREDGVAPDRVTIQGEPLYKPGPPYEPIAEPATDNSQFLVKLVFHVVRLTGKIEFFTEYAEVLERTMASVPRNEEGLVYIDPHLPTRSPYGFTDMIKKTGSVLFSSLLYWEAAGNLADLYERADRPEDAARWRAETERVKTALAVLWDDGEGMFLAATESCRQVDIWGSAYAAYIGAATEAQTDIVSRWFDTHYDEAVWEGMVRHIRDPNGWQAYVRHPLPHGTYQNGGFWPIPSAWVIHILRPVNPERASQMLMDLLRVMYTYGVFEWTNYEKFAGGKEYLASITMTLIAVREESNLRAR